MVRPPLPAPENPDLPARINDVFFGQVMEWDKEIFGADRSRLLKWMWNGAPEVALAIGNSRPESGYCFGRPGQNFFQIGPVVAADPAIAKRLVAGALKNCENRSVVMDVPHFDKEWKAWLVSIGFTEQRSFIRMFKGNNDWPGRPKSQYAILGPEFG
jgi:hypothetical protein